VFHGTPYPPDEEQELIATLIDEGIVRLHHLSSVRGLDDALLVEAEEVARAWSRTPPGTTAETIDLSVAEELIVARARRVAAVTQRRAEWDSLRSTLRAALNESAPTDAKTALHTLIDQIRVDARDHIEPTFRIPAVRIDYGYMEPTRLNANRFASLAGGRMSLDDAD
jgi:hypothetical protein